MVWLGTLCFGSQPFVFLISRRSLGGAYLICKQGLSDLLPRTREAFLTSSLPLSIPEPAGSVPLLKVFCTISTQEPMCVWWGWLWRCLGPQ